MSELEKAKQEADAMEAALAAPLFDGLRANLEAVLDGRGGDADDMWRREFRQLSIRTGSAVERALNERDAARKELGDVLWRLVQAEGRKSVKAKEGSMTMLARLKLLVRLSEQEQRADKAHLRSLDRLASQRGDSPTLKSERARVRGGIMARSAMLTRFSQHPAAWAKRKEK